MIELASSALAFPEVKSALRQSVALAGLTQLPNSPPDLGRIS